MSTCYTYLVGWSSHNLWYYGVRYAHNCQPHDLWVTYFTSSKKVKSARVLHGEPDVVQVRRRFKNKNDAVRWEGKVLRRSHAVTSPKWLNMAFTSNGCVHMQSQKGIPKPHGFGEKLSKARTGIKQSVPAWNKGIPMTDEAKENLRKVNTGKSAWNKGISNEAAKGVARTSEVKLKISNALKGRPRTEAQLQGHPHSDEVKRKLSEARKGKKWFHNGEVTKAFLPQDIIPEGFIPGRLNFNPHRNT